MKPETIKKFNDKLQALKKELGSDVDLKFLNARVHGKNYGYQPMQTESYSAFVDCSYSLDGNNFMVQYFVCASFLYNHRKIFSIESHITLSMLSHLKTKVNKALRYICTDDYSLTLNILIRETFTAQDCQELLESQEGGA